MLGRVLKEVKLPFPDDFFPAMALAPELQNEYHHKAYQLLHQTLRDEAPLTRFHPAQQPDNWKLIGERQGLQLYRERGADRGSALKVITIGSLAGSLEDVMWGLYAADHGSCKTQRCIMHNDYLDAAMLHVMEEDPFEEEDPGFTFRFAGLKWLACAPTGKLLHKRDVCWHEEMGLINDANGDEVGFLTMQSVRVSECPPFEQQGVKRSMVSVGYIFRDLGNGRTGVYMKGTHMVGGKSRSWSTDAVMTEMWLAMANVLDCSQSKRLSKLVSGKDVFVASQTSKTCDICDQKLKALKQGSGGQNCKSCGKHVCDRCRMTKLIYPSRRQQQTVAFPCSYFFCKRCLIDAKDQLYRKASRVSFQSEHSSHRSNSPRRRSSSQLRSNYSSSSAGSLYRGHGGNGNGGQYDRMRAPSRDHPPQYISEVKVKQLMSPRSSTSTAFSARRTATSESSFSDPATSSSVGLYPRKESIGASGSSSYQSYQYSRQMSAGAMSSGSSRGGAAAPRFGPGGDGGARWNAPSGSSLGSQPRDLYKQGSFVSSVGSSAYDVEEARAYSSSGLSSSDDGSSSGDEMDDAPSSIVAYNPPSSQRRPLSPTSQVMAKLRAIEMYADDETGLVELPGRGFQQPQPAQQRGMAQDDRLKYLNASQPSSNASTLPHQMNEREQMMQRLLQINMAAEATYLMAKHNAANLHEHR
uniref:FYVE-type domain-containing protein n=1 Tax=Globisporangium ultimum (strain ATCC 200006 / CBS 805.95 / DAOM BR144) TaxID=431595 RepID=K3WAH8_GLOUD